MNSLDAPAELDIFDRWLVTIEARFSIQIDANRQGAFKSALTRFVESIGMNLESLDERRKSGRVDAETWSMLLHLATNHETRFFLIAASH